MARKQDTGTVARRWIRGLIVVFVSILAPIALGVMLILVGEIERKGFRSPEMCAHGESHFRKLICGIAETREELAPFFRTPPTDQEMIRHFCKHRSEFDRLVHIYRYRPDLRTSNGFLSYSHAPSEAKSIMERLDIIGMSGDLQVWLPADVSAASGPQSLTRSELRKKAVFGQPEGRRFTGVYLAYGHPVVRRWSGNAASVQKGYYFIPTLPETANGILKGPFWNVRVVPTLDDRASRLIDGDCLYSQFEPHWFLKICQ